MKKRKILGKYLRVRVTEKQMKMLVDTLVKEREGYTKSKLVRGLIDRYLAQNDKINKINNN
jgi:hypothetical protein